MIRIAGVGRHSLTSAAASARCKSTQQITKAMKMVAASRLRRAQERIQQARPFATEMLRVLNSLATRVDPGDRIRCSTSAARRRPAARRCCS